MTIKEFSDEFDILYNNINSNQAPGLNDYEKSIFLTKAQEELILSYYSNIRNKFGEECKVCDWNYIDDYFVSEGLYKNKVL